MKRRPVIRATALFGGAAAMLLQTWCVPQLLAQESNRRANEAMAEQARRAERIGDDSSFSLGERMSAVRVKLDRAAMSVGSAIRKGEDPSPYLGDLAVLADRLERDAGELLGRVAEARAHLLAADAGPRVLANLDAFSARVNARLRECLRAIALVRAAGGGDAARTRAQELRRLLDGRPAGDAEQSVPAAMPSRGLSLASPRAGRPPFFQFPWDFADCEPEDLITTLLEQLDPLLCVTGEAPAAGDLASALPEIDVSGDLNDPDDPNPIIRQAHLLGRDPVRIFEFVRNRCAFEPSFGSVKGAARTLTELRGNDIDLASLQIALLRASGIHARYVFGTVEVTTEQASAWLGVNDPNQAYNLLSRAGVPVVAIEEGGRIARFQIDHVWVTAFVDAFPYRAAGRDPESPGEGDSWVDMDPSFKRHVVSGRNVEGDLGISPSTLYVNALASGEVQPAGSPGDASSAAAINQDLVRDHLVATSEPLRDYLAANGLDAETVFRQRTVAEEAYGLLPITDEYQIVSRALSLRVIPDALRHTLEITLTNPGGTQVLTHSAALMALAGRRITLSYVPAPGFEGVLDALPPAEADAVDFAAFLMRTKAQLRIGNALVAAAGTEPQMVGMGEPQQLRLTFSAPGQAPDTVVHAVTAGGVHALVLDLQRAVPGDLQAGRDQLASALTPAQVAALDGSEAVDLTIGESLHRTGLAYLYQMDRLNQTVAGSLGVAATRHPSVVRVSWDLTTSGLGGGSGTAYARSDRIRIAAGRDIHTAVTVEAPPQGTVISPDEHFHLISTLTGNALEPSVLLQAFARDAGVSVIDAFEALNDLAAAVPQSEPVPAALRFFTITAENRSLMTGGQTPLEVPTPVLARINDAVLAGAEVTALGGTVEVADEEYAVYVARDRTTNAAAAVLFDVASSREVGSEAVIDESDFGEPPLGAIGRTPRPADLLRRKAVASPFDHYQRYTDPTNSAFAWLGLAEDTATNAGLWYVPALANVNGWYAARDHGHPETTPATTPLAALTLGLPIGRALDEPAILNVAGRSGQADESRRSWVARQAVPGVSPDFLSNEFRIDADVTLGAQWQAILYRVDPNGEQEVARVPLAPSTDAHALARFVFPHDGSTPPTGQNYAVVGAEPDGQYRYRLEASDAGVAAVPVGGTFWADRAAPDAPELAVQASSAPVGLMNVSAFAYDMHFERYTIFARESGGPWVEVHTGTQPTPPNGPGDPPLLTILDTRPFPLLSDVRIVVQDQAGNQTEETVPAEPNNPPLPDTLPPTVHTVTLRQTSGGTIQPGASIEDLVVRVDVHASDAQPPYNPQGPPNGQIDRIEAIVDGQIMFTETIRPRVPEFSGQLSQTLELFRLPSGPHTLLVRVIDAGGNPSPDGPAARFEFITTGPIANFRVSPGVATPGDSTLDFTASVAGCTGTPPCWTIELFHEGLPVRDPYAGTGNGSVALTVETQAEGLFPALEDGDYTARLTRHSPEASAEIGFTVALQTPVASISLPDPEESTEPNAPDARHPLITSARCTLVGAAHNGPEADVQYKIEFFHAAATEDEIADPEARLFVAVPPQEAGGMWAVVPPPAAQDWTPLGAGIGGDPLGPTDGDLADLDLSGVPNGAYRIVLSVRASELPGAAVGRASRRVLLDCPLKIGELAFRQQDLTITSLGLQLAVVRDYSTFNLDREGPFGYGWTLSLLESGVNLHERRYAPGDLGMTPVGNPPPSGLTVRSGGLYDHDVTITLPDGEPVTFQFNLIVDPTDPRNQNGVTAVYRATYDAPPGVFAKLRTLMPEKLIVIPFNPLPPFWESIDPVTNEVDGNLNEPVGHHDISGWVLTMEDGTEYIIQRERLGGTDLLFLQGGNEIDLGSAWGDPYLAHVVAPTGETLEMVRDEATNTVTGAKLSVPGSGGPQLARTIAFATDSATPTRVRAVYAGTAVNPATLEIDYTHAPSAVYLYHETNDPDRRLRQVHRVTAKLGAITPPPGTPPYAPAFFDELAAAAGPLKTEPSSFQYEVTAGRTRYIKSVRDSRGRRPVLNEFDSAGRLIGIVDAFDRRVTIARDVEARTETVYDRKSPPAATSHQYDDRGNTTRTANSAGQLIERAYDDHDNQLSETLNGRTQMRYDYDAVGNMREIRNARDEVTDIGYTYGAEGRVSAITIDDNTGTAVSAAFDHAGNLTSYHVGPVTTINIYDPTTHRLQAVQRLEVDENGVPGPATPEVEYTYTDEGDIASMRRVNDPGDPNDDFVQEFGYDALGQEVFTSYTVEDPGPTGNPVRRVTTWEFCDLAGRSTAAVRQESASTALPDPDNPGFDYAALDPQAPSGGIYLIDRTYYNSYDDISATYNAATDTLIGFRYDAMGQEVERSEWRGLTPAQRQSAIAWFESEGAAGGLPGVGTLAKRPLVERTAYDDNGNPILETDSLPFLEDLSAPVPPAAECLGSHTIYDSLGREIEVRRVAGASVTLQVTQDPETQASIVRALASHGAVLSQAVTHYDGLGRVERVVDPGTGTTTHEFVGDSPFVRASINHLNERTEFEHDGAGRLLRTIDPLGHEVESVYNTSGQRTHVRHWGRPADPTDDFTLETIIDARGRKRADVDALGQRREYTYDNGGRLARVRLPSVPDPLNNGEPTHPDYEYDHDAHGNLVAITDPRGRVTSLRYDHLGRIVSRTYPGGQTESFEYHPVSGLVSRHTAAHRPGVPGEVAEALVTTFRYEAGELVERRHFVGPPDPQESDWARRYEFVPDDRGNITEVYVYQNGSGSAVRHASYSYDAEDRVTHATYRAGGATLGELSYEHDTRGFLIRTTVTPAGSPARETAYEYDEIGRLKRVFLGDRTNPLTPRYAYSYDPAGRQSALTFPGGGRTEYEYDGHGRAIRVEHFGAAGYKVLGFTHSVRADGRRTGAVETRYDPQGVETDQREVTYLYDAIGRLEREASHVVLASTPQPAFPPEHFEFVHDYRYDLVGNRYSRRVTTGGGPWTETAYLYDENDRLTEAEDSLNGQPQAPIVFGYKPDGFLHTRTQAGETVRFSQDAEGRIGQISIDGNPVPLATFGYDHAGFLVRSEGPGFVRALLPDEQNLTGFTQPAMESSTAPGVPTERGYPAGHRVLGQIAQAGLTHLLPDAHGSVRATASDAGPGIETSFDFDAYGGAVGFEAAEPTAPPASSFLYSGEVWEPAASMQFLRARWYDPGTGRFNRVDPREGSAQDPLTLHRYAYCAGDPVNFVDPTGEFTYIEQLLVTAIKSINFSHKLKKVRNGLHLAYKLLLTATILGNFQCTEEGGGFHEWVLAGAAVEQGIQITRLWRASRRVPINKVRRLLTWIMNGELRELRYGVPHKWNGFPDFRGNALHRSHPSVVIHLSGRRTKDFRLANQVRAVFMRDPRLLGSRPPRGYTWHHHEVMGIMQLVRTRVHRRAPHKGGVLMWELCNHPKRYR